MRAKPQAENQAEQEKAHAVFHWLAAADVVAKLGDTPAGKHVASEATVRVWIRTGKLKARNFGTEKRPRWLVKPEWVDEMLERDVKEAA